jgi:hypothetical protein
MVTDGGWVRKVSNYVYSLSSVFLTLVIGVTAFLAIAGLGIASTIPEPGVSVSDTFMTFCGYFRWFCSIFGGVVGVVLTSVLGFILLGKEHRYCREPAMVFIVPLSLLGAMFVWSIFGSVWGISLLVIVTICLFGTWRQITQ